MVKLPQLERLRLGRITDAGMAHLPVLPHVRVLDLSISEIVGPGLVHLEKVPKIEDLALDPTTLTVNGLAYLPELRGSKPSIWTVHGSVKAGWPIFAPRPSITRPKRWCI